MTEFNELAEKILVSMVHGTGRRKDPRFPDLSCEATAGRAVKIALEFRKALREARQQLVSEGGLTPEEADAIQNNMALKAIKLVRERLGLTLMDAKAYVDKAKVGLDL